MEALALASAQELPLATCNACNSAPVTNRGYSTCRLCRDKRNDLKRKSKEKKREEKRRLHLKAVTRDNIPVSKPVQSASAGKKRKAPAEEDNKADALERMRKRFKKMEFHKIDAAPTTSSTTSSMSVFEKFVDDKHLYKAIKRRYPDSTNSFRFYGTYAIIAMPDVDNKLQARQVARTLRSSTALHFNLDDKEAYTDETAHTVHYKCTCRAAPIKRDLSAYFGSTNTAALDETPKVECRGRIDICVEDDRSHPLGWLGQRIKVTVTHPKKM
ncbi:hypothetical protein B0H12DRAFT_1224021 [Mycena haematopus]|nr:hypothetical protein B0H12DRAFT_1157715 [Mycena haematopus]KAJ7223672.1 hypothetical protein B0H12DRAFT_1224021 [Mycena haematopus]